MDEQYGHRNWFLVQDVANPHTALETLDYLKTYRNILENWPAFPRFKPNWKLAGIVKWRVEEIHPQSVEDLIRISFYTWENISVQTIQNLISSVPNRLLACINTNGMGSGY